MSVARPAFHMIWTRPIDNQPMAGRLRIATAVRDALRQAGRVTEHVIAPAVTVPLPIAVLAMGWAFLKSLLIGPLLPVQCLLYTMPSELRRAIESVPADAEVIYLDGVRTFVLLRLLRQRFPRTRIVVDLDDLMSRRMQLLLHAGQTLSPGYLTACLPPTLVTRLTGALGQLVVRYEAATLPRVEVAVTRLADAIVLLSPADMRALGGAGAAERAVIPPPVSGDDFGAPRAGLPPRFLFIGSDSLTQNRMTIDYLLGLWDEYRFATELVIVGRQGREIPLPPNVTMTGYVDSLADVYDGRSILVSPSFLAGGIKTKVLEAFAHHTPVIGNSATFEGLSLGDYPLLCDDERTLIDLLRAPESYRPLLDEAARQGAAYVRVAHDPALFARKWLSVMAGHGVPVEAEAPRPVVAGPAGGLG